MKFEEQFPSLENKEQTLIDHVAEEIFSNPVYFGKDIEKYCLDKQKVMETIEDLSGIAHRMIAKKGIIFPKDELRKHWEDLKIELEKQLGLE